MSRRAAVPINRGPYPKFFEKERDGQPCKTLKKCRHVSVDDVELFRRCRDPHRTKFVRFQLDYEGKEPHIAIDPRYEDYIVLNVDNSKENVLDVTVRVISGKEQFVRYHAENSKKKREVKILADGSPVAFLHFGDWRDGKRKSSPNAASDAVFSKRPRRLEAPIEEEFPTHSQPLLEDDDVAQFAAPYAADSAEALPESVDMHLDPIDEDMSPDEVDRMLETAHANPNLPTLRGPGTPPWHGYLSNDNSEQDVISSYSTGSPVAPERPTASAPAASPIFNPAPAEAPSATDATEPKLVVPSVEATRSPPSVVAAEWLIKNWPVVSFSIVLLLALLLGWTSPSSRLSLPSPLPVHDDPVASNDFLPIVALPSLLPVDINSLEHEISLADRRFSQIQLWHSHLHNTSSPIFRFLSNTSNQGSARLNQLVTAARLHNDIACSILKTRRTPLLDHAIKNFEQAHNLIWHAAAIDSLSDKTKQGEPLAMPIYLHAVRQLLVNYTTSPQRWTMSEERKADYASVEVAKLAHITLATYSFVLSLRTDMNTSTRSIFDSNVKANLSDMRGLRTFQSDDRVFVIFKHGPDEVTAELCSVNCWSDSWITRPWTFTLFSERSDDCRDRYDYRQ
eukprot:TRINITY_DN5624_c0_g1_i1.p1 TRINITY_DN5624_c0_g1~~TRINITY_DN5624_c0_g1_i1.p1  ORF type:complete len:622 (+),score=76.67 TRINITY_DN5624_c0_g1_i1:231-2096(+)